MTTKLSPQDLSQRTDAINAFADLIAEIRVGMLTTRCPNNELRSRPMLTAITTFNGELWFFTDSDDAKVAEISAHPQVGICYADPHHEQYVSVSGTAEIVRDSHKMELLWEESVERWFPGGKDKVVLVRISIEDGEYWNLHDNLMFKLGHWIKGLVSEHQVDDLDHEKIDLKNRA